MSLGIGTEASAGVFVSSLFQGSMILLIFAALTMKPQSDLVPLLSEVKERGAEEYA
jgi:hypothetical protein